MSANKTTWARSCTVPLLATGIVLGGCSNTADKDGLDTASQISDVSNVVSVDPARFVDGALQSSNVVDCKLSDGNATQCYQLFTTGAAKTTDSIGPFCPETITTAAADAGVWLDGTSLYDADGDFILDLPELYGQKYPPADQWILYQDDGTVRVTDTLEA